MRCRIIFQHKKEEFPKVTSVVLPAFAGEMEVLPGHAEAFIKLRAGTVVLRNRTENSIDISSGVCYINNDEVLIIQ